MKHVPPHTPNRRRTLVAGLAWGCIGAPGALRAQSSGNFPERPITIVAPMAAGGSTDVVARLLAKNLTDALRQPALVENKPGATGSIGTMFVARSAPDGHTLLLAPGSVAVVNPLVTKVGYDFARDFRPVGLLAMVETVLVASRRSGLKSVAEVVDRAKANPGKLSFGSNGEGGSFHLGGELFALAADIDLLHVPYKGAAPAETALVTGEIDLLVTNTVSVMHHIRAGAIVPLAVISSGRSRELPAVPRGDALLPGFTVDTWLGLYAPSATSAAAVLKLNETLNAFLRNKENADDMLSRGLEPAPGSIDDALRFQQAETARWSKVVDTLRAKKRLA
jgi:tripartite-type tricarboxylate transporter receptor subunit TctC